MRHMQKYNLTDLVEFNNNRFSPKVLINEPGYQMVPISMLVGQLILEHAAPNKGSMRMKTPCFSFWPLAQKRQTSCRRLFLKSLIFVKFLVRNGTMSFAKFDALAPGASLRLLNDHDPIPLNRQFEMIRPGQAFWDYLGRGPSLFRIRIRKQVSPSLGHFVRNDISAIAE
jgi:uncharacterized protein (DUF2249 family)